MGVTGDLFYFGGGALLAVGAGLQWGLGVGLMVAGLVSIAAVAPIIWRRPSGRS